MGGIDEERTPTWRHPEFGRGAREMADVSLGVAAWGLITGVTMIDAGLTVSQAAAMSVLVYAGSAQLAALPLMAAGAPWWVVWATAVCINLRFVIFSAGWRPYFAQRPRGQRMRVAYFAADLNYVVFMRRFPEARPAPGQWPYFWGGAVTVWLSWQLCSFAGIFLGDHIPTDWGIGFAGTLALIALTSSMLGDRRTWLPAGVAGCAAVAAYALPLKLNLVVAIAAAVAVGLFAEARTGRPGAAT